MQRVVISLLLALCVAFVAHAQMDCYEKEGVTPEEVDHFVENLDDAESNPKLKCFTACIHELEGTMRNCKINDAFFAQAEIPKEFLNLYETCQEEMVAGERCECAYQLVKCLEVESMTLTF